MRLIAWNLNHRIRAKPIPAGVINVIRHMAPDILVLTEYVDGQNRADFKQALHDMGLLHISVSEKRDRHNQVLVASRTEHSAAASLTALPESHAFTNFLAVSFSDPAFILIGVRAPAYDSSSEVHAYWASLTQLLDSVSDRKVVAVGDMNGDPDASRSVGGKYLKELRGMGWKVPTPSGEWSYMSSDGRGTSRIDHVLASPNVGSVSAAYVAEVNGTIVAGPKDSNPTSDHAILRCDVKLDEVPA